MAISEDIVVECRNLRKSYILGEIRVDALRGINMKINRGEMISIMGPSGCGKTTLLNIIGSLDNPSSGQVLLEGSDISRATEQQLTDIRRKSVGFIFQFYNLLPVLTAIENVELPMLIAGIPKKEAAAGDVNADSIVKVVPPYFVPQMSEKCSIVSDLNRHLSTACKPREHA